MNRNVALVAAALCAVATLSCAGRPAAPVAGQPGSGPVVRFENRLRAPKSVAKIRCAVDFEIRYMNIRTSSHPVPPVIAQLAIGPQHLYVEIDVTDSGSGETILLRQARSVVVRGSSASVVVVLESTTDSTNPVRLTLKPKNVALKAAADQTPPRCDALNPDLSGCEGKDAPTRAWCIVQSIHARARKKMNAGWAGCVSHQRNRLRTARQHHLHGAKGTGPEAEQHRAALFTKAGQYADNAIACVNQYYYCTQQEQASRLRRGGGYLPGKSWRGATCRGLAAARGPR